MKEIALYTTGVGITLVLSLVVITYIRPHLQLLLVDLCGTRERANFWGAFSNVALAIAPLILALGFDVNEFRTAPGVMVVGSQLKQGLVALLGTFMTLGLVVSLFIPGETPRKRGHDAWFTRMLAFSAGSILPN